MNRITLNNNIQMPMLGFGTFLMGGSECEESVLAAIRSGYRMIDTAEVTSGKLVTLILTNLIETILANKTI